ncbi:S24 family peptidase [Singulisphaera sp. PoT]|uniref:S24 family peptidase n=1 Tax=Singulisphaera sp. PoT TaxID=3411797 RepID=UPI003BF4AF92
MLKLIEMTFVEPAWLLHGQNPQFRTQKGDGLGGDRISTQNVSEMLRTVVDILEKNVGEYPVHAHNRILGANGTGDSLPLHPSYDSTHAVNSENGFAGGEFAPMPSGLDFRSEKNTCIRNVGDSMLPIVADGASVAYSQERENASALDGKLVVAWIDGKPVVRWFQLCGRYGMLRAENAASDATQVLVDLENSPQETSVRRVLWISTPH